MRRATSCAVVVMAVISILVVSFPSLSSTVGLNPNSQTVNRSIKGDRLPIQTISSARQPSSISRTQKKVPVGCDNAFSSISSPQLATVFGRCLV